MSIKALQEYTRIAKYANYLPELQRRETWKEQISRVFGMHRTKYSYALDSIEDELAWVQDLVAAKRVLGSQRALQFGGDPILKANARLFNCTVSYCDRPRFFQETMYLLLCGCGVGFSVQHHHVAKLPGLFDRTDLITGASEPKVFVVPDSIEGWADAIGVLISAYMTGDVPFPEFQGRPHLLQFDFSQIRPEGAPLSSGQKAPGPDGLERSLEKIRGVLEGALGRQLRPIEAYDIVMHAADAVISGGVRRSATIAMFSPDDMEMAQAKTGNWLKENPQRGRSNNSALLVRDRTSFEDFKRLVGWTKEFGEPGFVWSDSTELLVNPCVTGDTIVATDRGLVRAVDLVDVPFNALVDSKVYKAKDYGFQKTGVKETIVLKMQSGRSLELTPNHKVLTPTGWLEAGNLELHDQIRVHQHSDFDHSIEKNTEYARGWLLGQFLGDGNVSRGSGEVKFWGESRDYMRAHAMSMLELAGWKNNHHKDEIETKSPYSSLRSVELYRFADHLGCLDQNQKHLSSAAEVGSWDYLAGLLSAYFDADGTVANSDKNKCVRLWSVQLDNLQAVQRILGGFGINSRIYLNRIEAGWREMPDGNGGVKPYWCQAGHELVISKKSILTFAKKIGFTEPAKAKQLDELVNSYVRGPYSDSEYDSVIEIQQGKLQPVYDCTVPGPEAFDANGLYVHNCVEISMWPVLEQNGTLVSGWQFCNLCEINGRKCDTPESFFEACRAAAILGTLQAGYTSFPYLGQASEEITAREALLGVSITGMMDSPDVLFDPDTLQEGARIVKQTNAEIAAKIGINPAARTTCVKPAGTSSCILGTASGIHPHHARRYFRRVQANRQETPLQFYESRNPLAVQDSVWDPNGVTRLITFLCEVPKGARTKNQVDALTLLEHVKLVQQNWVVPGTNKDLCVQPWLRHNVSNTINVKEDEWDSVTEFIYQNREWYAGISLLPNSGDKDYPQAPFCAVPYPREVLSEYGTAVLYAESLARHAIDAFGDLWEACNVFLAGTDVSGDPTKENVTSMAREHADTWFGGDMRKLTYMLKDVYNILEWERISRAHQEVDWIEFIETDDSVNHAGESACAGGACELPDWLLEEMKKQS